MLGAKLAGRLGWVAQADIAAGQGAGTLEMRCPYRLPWAACERCQLRSGQLGGNIRHQRAGNSQPKSSQDNQWDTHPPWQDTVSSNASPSLDGTACRISALSIPSAKLRDFKSGYNVGFLYQASPKAHRQESPRATSPIPSSCLQNKNPGIWIFLSR